MQRCSDPVLPTGGLAIGICSRALLDWATRAKASAPTKSLRNRLSLPTLIVALLVSTALGAADGKPIADGLTRPRLTFDALLSIPDKGANLIRLFLPAGESGFDKVTAQTNVFHEPPIFMTTEYGRLKAAVGDDNSVTLHFRWDEDTRATKGAIRRYIADLQAQMKVAEHVDPSLTVQVGPPELGQINIIPFASGRFYASTDKSIRSERIDGDLTSSTAELRAVFPFTDKARAEAFVSDLHRDLGGTQLVFSYHFDGVLDLRCSASVGYSDIDMYSPRVDARGEGAEGFVSRHEVIKAVREVVSRTVIDSRCGDSELAAMLIDSVVTQLGEPKVHDIAEYDRDLTGYRDEDFKADVVDAEKLIENEVTRLIEDVHKASSAEAGGRFDYSANANIFELLEGGVEIKAQFISAHTALSRELSDRLAKSGTTATFEGRKYVPKTITHYSRRDLAQRLNESVSETLTVTLAAATEYRILVGKPNWSPTQSVPLKEIVSATREGWPSRGSVVLRGSGAYPIVASE